VQWRPDEVVGDFSHHSLVFWASPPAQAQVRRFPKPPELDPLVFFFFFFFFEKYLKNLGGEGAEIKK